jgi:Holliday junction resolvase RusA-like endonuclease
MPEISFNVPGNPVAWARARRCGNKYFNTDKSNGYKSELKYQFLKAVGTLFKPLDCPIILIIMAVFPMPKSATKGEKLTGERIKTTKPDLDNLIKIIGDGLNGVAWIDDARINIIHASKTESTKPPHVSIKIIWSV